MLTIEGDAHKNLRRFTMPLISKCGNEDVIKPEIIRTLNALTDESHEAFDPTLLLNETAFNVTVNFLFGLGYSHKTDPVATNLLRAFQNLVADFSMDTASPFIISERMFFIKNLQSQVKVLFII